MGAKYTIVRESGSSLVNVTTLDQIELDILTKNGVVVIRREPIIFVKDPKQPDYKAATITKTAVSNIVRKHRKQGRHLNQSVGLSREGMEDVVFSKEVSKVMMARWNIKRPFVNRLRVRIKGTKAEKMSMIRCITETPKRTSTTYLTKHNHPSNDIEFHSERRI